MSAGDAEDIARRLAAEVLAREIAEHEARVLRERLAVGERELHTLRAELEAAQAAERAARQDVFDLHERLLQRDIEIAEGLGIDLTFRQGSRPRRQAPPLQQLLQAHLPSGTGVLVVSDGDEQYIRAAGPDARHFPQGEDGGFLNVSLPDGAALREHLLELQRRGASLLVVPDAVAEWLEYYPEFRQYLETELRVVVQQRGVGTLYALNG